MCRALGAHARAAAFAALGAHFFTAGLAILRGALTVFHPLAARHCRRIGFVLRSAAGHVLGVLASAARGLRIRGHFAVAAAVVSHGGIGRRRAFGGATARLLGSRVGGFIRSGRGRLLRRSGRGWCGGLLRLEGQPSGQEQSRENYGTTDFHEITSNIWKFVGEPGGTSRAESKRSRDCRRAVSEPENGGLDARAFRGGWDDRRKRSGCGRWHLEGELRRPKRRMIPFEAGDFLKGHAQSRVADDGAAVFRELLGIAG